MGPVVGLDVSKGTSTLQAFTDRNKPYGKMINIAHTQDGFEKLGNLLEELKQVTGLEPAVVLEAPKEALNDYVEHFTLLSNVGLSNGANERLKTYYEKKRKEGKPYKVVVIACANKLLHHIHAILVKGEPYQA